MPLVRASVSVVAMSKFCGPSSLRSHQRSSTEHTMVMHRYMAISMTAEGKYTNLAPTMALCTANSSV